MLEFKKIELKDIELFKENVDTQNEFSCETSFVNLLIWQSAYNNMIAINENHLFVKSGFKGNDIFRLPFGKDFKEGIEMICEYSHKEYPDFWVQDGKRLEQFKKLFNNTYCLTDDRNSFDYIYQRTDLAELAGKKYHSKRNHISSFTNQFEWHYEDINKNNINDVYICAEKWYAENYYRTDKYLMCEKVGLDTILNNMEILSIKGGAIYINNSVVAFTLGSPINREVFDIHIEKALSQYKEAYTIINREFAKNSLSQYQYINREDDMGIEGLRKAKLSYKPDIILKKYSATVIR